jgi:hypothetical protein
MPSYSRFSTERQVRLNWTQLSPIDVLAQIVGVKGLSGVR